MKHLIKSSLYRLAPRWATALMSARARKYSHKMLVNWGCHQVNQALISRVGNCVQEGPFAGLLLTPMTHAEQIGPYLLGVYESELDKAWGIIFQSKYAQIIDIGAKFGYYAVGLAKRYPNARTIAFDTDWWARKAIREMVVANETSNVRVKSFCSPDWLARYVLEDAFIISDCEGYEAMLFEQHIIPRLRSATVLIETHDCLVPGVTEKLFTAFSETHSIRMYGETEVRRETTHPLTFFSDAERQLAIQEVRPEQAWLLCLPKARNLRT